MIKALGLHPYSRLGAMEALEGARILERRLNVVANDMANVDTVGFKTQHVTFHEYFLSQVDKTKRTAKGEFEWTDFSQGALEHTGNPLDFAITGKGFFAVKTPAGICYTRAGNFTLNAQDQLVTQQGYPVLGRGGAPIVLKDTTGKGIWLSGDGRLYVDGEPVDSFKIVTFNNPNGLSRIGDNLFMQTPNSGPPQEAKKAGVRQGYIEDSNVNPVTTMVNLIEIYRGYEAEQKTLKTVDQLNTQAAREIGRLRT